MEKSRIGRLAKRAAIRVAMIGMAAIGFIAGNARLRRPAGADQATCRAAHTDRFVDRRDTRRSLCLVQPYGVNTSIKVDVGKSNSIVHLLTAFLEWLADAYPAEGWSRFLRHGSPKWSSIALSGLSQGAGNAAMIAKHSIVPRVVMLSGVTDAIPGPQWCQGSSDWLTDHRTPVDRYWGLAHDRDPNYPAICRNWDSIGITALGPLVQVEKSAPPYACTHQLFTDLPPQKHDYGNAHPSTVADIYTPLEDGTPKLAGAWDYLLTAKAGEEGADN